MEELSKFLDQRPELLGHPQFLLCFLLQSLLPRYRTLYDSQRFSHFSLLKFAQLSSAQHHHSLTFGPRQSTQTFAQTLGNAYGRVTEPLKSAVGIVF